MQEPKDLILKNNKVRALIQIRDGIVKELYYGLSGGKETLIAKSPAGSSFAACKANIEPYHGTEIKYDYPDQPVVLHNEGPDEYTEQKKLAVGEPLPLIDFKLVDYKAQSNDGLSEIILTGESKEGYSIKRIIALGEDSDYFAISNSLDIKHNVNLEYFTDYYDFAPGYDPDFTWTPQLKYDSSGVCCDWTFRSPSVLIQKKNAALALVPDLNFLYNDKSIMYCTTSVDLNIKAEPAPKAAYGFIPSEPHYHSMFIHPVGLKNTVPKGRMNYKYFLFPSGNSPEKQSYRRIVDFQWEEFGHGNLMEGHNAQLKSFNLMEKEGWHWLARKFWIEFDYKGQRCGGFRDYHRGLSDDIWFFSWWNCLRTAYGMEVYAKRRNHRQTSEKAHAILNLILNAPRTDGVFPAVYYVEDDERIWAAGSPSGFGGPIDCYHTYSMSWTAFWLLKWKQDLEDDERIMPLCEDYAKFLLRNQHESGFIPSYYSEDDLSVDPDMQMNEESAEPAASALFLTEIYKVAKKKEYLEAAKKAIRYVEKVSVPENKWYDFETFYSCSPKEFGYFDKITGQYAQCNMAMFKTTKTALELYKITEDKHYLEFGERILDYLSLFQQVWSHPRMELNLIGGFTTQNTDCEWSDSRQAQCAILYMDYFEETGDIEYLERGIAALRACLTISPYENWSHRGFNSEPGYFSSFSWGIGTGLVSVEILWERYGDILVDVDSGWAYGINGCTVRGINIDSDSIELNVQSDINYVAPLKVVFRGAGTGSYKIVANGQELGEYSMDALTQGIEWFFSKQR